jgi:hypothetical protein
MKRYSVLVPFTGCVEVEVEANDKEEAKRLGYEKACEEIESADTLWDNISEWDFCEIMPSNAAGKPLSRSSLRSFPVT